MLLLLLGCVDSWCDRFNLDCELESVAIVPGADEDGDLWSAGEDCDDADAAINPGADEVCDGFDNDCDDRVDEPGATGEQSFYPDEDGDGFGADAEPQLGCEAPAGTSGVRGDCDDSDAGTNLFAEEVAYDGIDQDCDGEDLTDPDGDGWLPPEDCDDTTYAIRPGRDEVCNDGVDNDCAPETVCRLEGAYDLGDVLYESKGGGPRSGFGSALARVRSPGDGRMDILVGAPFGYSDGAPGGGFAYVFRPGGATEDFFFEESFFFQSEVSSALLGTSVDGLMEGGELAALLGAPGAGGLAEGAGSAVVFRVVEPGEYGTGAADGLFRGDQAGDSAGAAVRLVGDYDGDGREDALVGAPGRASGAGAAWLLRGPLTGALEENASLIEGIIAGEAAGSALLAVDVDGSGVTDLAVGAPGGDAVFLLRDGEIPASLLDAERFGGDAGGELGAALAAQDLDGDGRAELLVGAPGAGYVAALGDAGGALDEAWRCTSQEAGDRAGASVSGAGDLDGDERGDLVVGAPFAWEGGEAEESGVVYALYGPLSAGCELQSAPGFSVRSYYGYFGAAVLGGGQLDGVAWDDLVIGMPYWLEPSEDPNVESGRAIAVFTLGL